MQCKIIFLATYIKKSILMRKEFSNMAEFYGMETFLAKSDLASTILLVPQLKALSKLVKYK